MEDLVDKPCLIYVGENLRIFPSRKKRGKIKETSYISDIEPNICDKHWNKCIRGYFIYFLICPIENIIRYIGLTKDPKERFRGHKKDKDKNSQYKERWIEKLRAQNLIPIFKIVEKNLLLETAKKVEIEYISKYREIVGDKLTNISEGGNVPPTLFGDLSPSKRPEVRAKISAAKQKEKHHLWGVSPSDETRLLMAVAVDKYDLKGNLLKEYGGMFEACREHKIQKTNISSCCRGTVKTAGGFIWRFHGDAFSMYDTNIIDLRKKVVQVDLQGNDIQIFDGINEAVHATGIFNIGSCCNGKRFKAGGFKWRFLDE